MKRILLKSALALTIFVGLVLLLDTGVNTFTNYHYKTATLDMSPKLTKEHTIFIVGNIIPGPVYKQDLERPKADMGMVNRKTAALVRRGVKNINVIIDSYGGRVDAGMSFISLMKSAQKHGVQFTCIVRNKAMSMATIIFSECDTRRALFGSRIMWHSALIGYLGRINQGFLETNLKRFKELNNELWQKTKTFFSADYFKEHFDLETQIDVKELEREGERYLRVINSYKLI